MSTEAATGPTLDSRLSLAARTLDDLADAARDLAVMLRSLRSQAPEPDVILPPYLRDDAGPLPDSVTTTFPPAGITWTNATGNVTKFTGRNSQQEVTR